MTQPHRDEEHRGPNDATEGEPLRNGVAIEAIDAEAVKEIVRDSDEQKRDAYPNFGSEFSLFLVVHKSVGLSSFCVPCRFDRG